MVSEVVVEAVSQSGHFGLRNTLDQWHEWTTAMNMMGPSQGFPLAPILLNNNDNEGPMPSVND